jgi:hypothetical protein
MHHRFWVILQTHRNGAITVFNERAYVDSEEASAHYGQMTVNPMSDVTAIDLAECTISKTVLHKEA